VVEAVAIITVKTNMYSSKVLRKHLGRALGSWSASEIAISASISRLLTSEYGMQGIAGRVF
jgi:hypothetical protein